MDSLAALSDEQLVDGIVTWSGRIAAGEARLLTLIAEFDRREAWGGVGLLSCAHWLSWRTSLLPSAAREKVRVARALTDLPLVQEAFGAGRLSYSQVRAVTRVATVEEQQTWIDAARSSTASQLERVVRGVRRARKVDEDAADPELAAWRMQAPQELRRRRQRRLPAGPARRAGRRPGRRARAGSGRAGPAGSRRRSHGRFRGSEFSTGGTARRGGRGLSRFRGSRLSTAAAAPAGHPRRRLPRPGADRSDHRTTVRRAPGQGTAGRAGRPAHRLGPARRRRTAPTDLAAQCPDDPAGSRRPPPAPPDHRHRPAPARPGPQPAPAQPGAARAAQQPGRRALPLPRLHPAPHAARPPRPVLARRRRHRPGQPAAALQPPPHPGPRPRLRPAPAPRPAAGRHHRRGHRRPAPPRPALAPGP